MCHHYAWNEATYLSDNLGDISRHLVVEIIRVARVVILARGPRRRRLGEFGLGRPEKIAERRGHGGGVGAALECPYLEQRPVLTAVVILAAQDKYNVNVVGGVRVKNGAARYGRAYGLAPARTATCGDIRMHLNLTGCKT